MLPSISWGIWDTSFSHHAENNNEVLNHQLNRYTHKEKSKQLSRDHKFEPLYKNCLEVLTKRNIHPYYEIKKQNNENKINWEIIPYSLSPRGGRLPNDRIERKINQVESMMIHVMIIIDSLLLSNKQNNKYERIKVVEFCAGSGFVSLPLSFLYPQV